MKNNVSKLRILFLINLSITIINCKNNFPNNIKNNDLGIRKKKFQVKKRKESMPKRKLDEFTDSDYIPYHIYLDLFNFEKTIPDALKSYKNTILSSMNKAKETFESLIQIYNYGLVGDNIIRLDELNEIGILYYNETLFKLKSYENVDVLDLANKDENIDLVILIKFSDNNLVEDGVASAQIFFSNPYPEIGIITLSKNFPTSKLTSNYLDPLMLHLFTHIIIFWE